jgi:DNA-binding transcriptional MerR regulator/effector-binding domain-containing protein
VKLKIGEFARLGQISVQALRYYDSLNLIKPAAVDHFSSYRYYTLDQLPRLMQILALKDLGFSLDQISHLLNENLETNELRRMLVLKQQELRTQLQGQLDQLERIDARLQWIEHEQTSPECEVVLKEIDPVCIASVRGMIPSFWEVNPLWVQLQNELVRCQITAQEPYFTLCHASEPEIDVEVCAPVSFECHPRDDLQIRLLPGVKNMACTIHRGPFTGIITSFTRLVKWVDANGLMITGPDREIYLRLPATDAFDSDQNAITELQIPVQRKDKQVNVEQHWN